MDAAVLARMGRALDLAPTPPPDPDRAQLAALVARREDLVTTIGRENNRLGVAVDPWIAKETRSLVRVLKSHLESVEVQIATLIETRQPLATASRRLHSVTGIGPVVAAVLPARLRPSRASWTTASWPALQASRRMPAIPGCTVGKG